MANPNLDQQKTKEALANDDVLNMLADAKKKYEDYIRLTSYTVDNVKEFQREIYRDVNYPLSIVIR